MKNKVFTILTCSMLLLSACGANNTDNSVDTETAGEAESAETQTTEDEVKAAETGEVLSNSLFSITMPADLEGIYEAEVEDQQITLYHKESKDAGYNGMAYTIWAREMPPEFYGGPYMKKGELTDADGTRYEVVIGYATEVQWDFEKYAEMPEDFQKLYDSQDEVLANMTGVNGATFEYLAGTKGEDLYGDVVAKYQTALDEEWDASKFEENEMSPEFYSISQTDGASGIGIAYYDTDKDGVDELFVGTLVDDELRGSIYDIYTMVDGAPAHVATGTARNRFYVYSEGMIVNEYSSGALENGKLVYCLEPNSAEMVYQWGTKIDAYTNEDQPWFISYTEDEWENVTEDEFNSREAASEDYTDLEFKALSDL